MTSKRSLVKWVSVAVLCGLAASSSAVQQTLAPDRIADVLNTKHNFASNYTPKLPNNATSTVKSTEIKEVCVFCHTPHAATQGLRQLWNRELSANPTNYYSSTTMDVSASVAHLGDGSKMCLSCHDGTIAIGNINALNGKATVDPYTATPSTNSLSTTYIPNGAGANSGYTSNVGQDLRNDHPIAIEYNATIANNDGELYAPGLLKYNSAASDLVPISDKRDNIAIPPIHPAAPLESIGGVNTVQCTTCHDPHIRGTGADQDVNIKFLRLNRFQKNTPQDGTFVVANDQICLGCHNKTGWSNSAHAKNGATPYTYSNAAADQREFPRNLHVWEAGCLNCHDTHTVAGAPRLLRAATDSASGGNSATEQTCYQCHGAQAGSAMSTANLTNIEAAFLSGTATSVSISSHGDKLIAATSPYTEAHAPAKKGDLLVAGTNALSSGNLTESSSNLNTNRHVECSDCHHPHRMQNGIHTHTSAHNNSSSGVLSGVFGVEPVVGTPYGAFSPYDTGTTYITFAIKQGDSTAVDRSTKEYQICLKCHSNYGLDSSKINATQKVANVAAELLSGTSKHPVIAATGGSGAAAAAFVTPFNQAVGTQTMYCSDCHESHSGKMKKSGDNLCYDCHSTASYSNLGGTVAVSGFSCNVAPCVSNAGATAPSNNTTTFNNLHVRHAQLVPGYRCNDCHTLQMHGWKIKSFLVDLNNVAGEVSDTPPGAKTPGYTFLPYYDNAKLQLSGGVAAASGAWTKGSCGASGCHVLPN